MKFPENDYFEYHEPMSFFASGDHYEFILFASWSLLDKLDTFRENIRFPYNRYTFCDRIINRLYRHLVNIDENWKSTVKKLHIDRRDNDDHDIYIYLVVENFNSFDFETFNNCINNYVSLEILPHCQKNIPSLYHVVFDNLSRSSFRFEAVAHYFAKYPSEIENISNIYKIITEDSKTIDYFVD